MIVGSIGLVFVAVVLLVLGLVRQVDAFYYSSIAASVLAALALLVGVRQFPSGRLPEADFDVRTPGARLAPWPSPVGRAGVPRQARLTIDEAGTPAPEAAVVPPLVDDGTEMAAAERAELASLDDVIPADEPDEQPVTYEDTMALGRISAEVVVIDGRPRFHIDDCLHLLGRTVQRLTVREAAVLGFTPCALCEPVARLLRDS